MLRTRLLPSLARPIMRIDPTAFKAYYIRGIVGKSLDEAFAEHLGRAFGSQRSA